MRMWVKGISFSLIPLLCIVFRVMAGEKILEKVKGETLIAKIDFSTFIPESFKVSPDCKHVAFTSKAGEKLFVVIDGKEEKHYDGIVISGGGRIIFDLPTTYHYLVLKSGSIFSLEKKLI